MRLGKASIYFDGDLPFVVTQTPGEVAAMVANAGPADLIEFTLGNESEWNGKPLFVRAYAILAVSPPKDQAPADE